MEGQCVSESRRERERAEKESGEREEGRREIDREREGRGFVEGGSGVVCGVKMICEKP